MPDESKLSPRAQRLWALVQAGRWYPAFGEGTPKAMRELEDAGLVMTMGRVARIVSCWVPVGTVPFVPERFPCTHPVMAQPIFEDPAIVLCPDCGEWKAAPSTILMTPEAYEILKKAAKP